MKNHPFIDLGRMMDEIFSRAEDVGSVFEDRYHTWDRGRQADMYPFYAYPPSNIYMKENKTIVFEFALAGFREEEIDIQFQGDYLLLSARTTDKADDEQGAHFIRRRLKRKDIDRQRYLVPEDKYDQTQTEAQFVNGLLRVSIPPRQNFDAGGGIRVEINKEEQ